MVGKLGQIRAERNALIQQVESQDDRLRKTNEIISLFDDVRKPIEIFDAGLFNKLVDKIVVKERECIVFYLKNSMELEECYEFKRGDDIV